MPGARLPDAPSTPAPADWYSPEELAAFRLPPKSFWDVPILVDGQVVHVIALHPTPPTFDGPEDRNGLRNADEIRLAADYVTPGKGTYIYDDQGRYGGLEPGAPFVDTFDLGGRLYVGTENALEQDGPAAALGIGSPSRITEYDTATGCRLAEYVYATDPVADAPVPAGAFASAGLAELLALDDEDTLLALERSFSTGVGNDIRLCLVRTEGATDVSGAASLQGLDYQPAEKNLLLDLAGLGLAPDNVEGMAFGPDLPDGRKTLVLVSDDNFSPTQTTQFIALALDLGLGNASPATGSDPW